jgi:hypothetical protein
MFAGYVRRVNIFKDHAGGAFLQRAEFAVVTVVAAGIPMPSPAEPLLPNGAR